MRPTAYLYGRRRGNRRDNQADASTQVPCQQKKASISISITDRHTVLVLLVMSMPTKLRVRRVVSRRQNFYVCTSKASKLKRAENEVACTHLQHANSIGLYWVCTSKASKLRTEAAEIEAACTHLQHAAAQTGFQIWQPRCAGGTACQTRTRPSVLDRAA